MAVRYHRRADQRPDYLCQIHTLQSAENPCQVIPGAILDAAIGQLLLETMTPMALEVSLAVWQEIQDRQKVHVSGTLVSCGPPLVTARKVIVQGK
jgi:hypothetical protein